MLCECTACMIMVYVHLFVYLYVYIYVHRQKRRWIDIINKEKTSIQTARQVGREGGR